MVLPRFLAVYWPSFSCILTYSTADKICTPLHCHLLANSMLLIQRISFQNRSQIYTLALERRNLFPAIAKNVSPSTLTHPDHFAHQKSPQMPESECKWHDHPKESQYHQTSLTSKNGLLNIGPILQQRRSRAPHVVTRISNSPVYTSPTLPHLTSFVRFPVEIRLQIYRYLMVFNGNIQYEFCIRTQRLLERHYCSSQKVAWTRYVIFPAILETCRQFNQEGSAILYGENTFRLTKHHQQKVWLTGLRTTNSWTIGHINMKCITSVQISHNAHYITVDSVPAIRGQFARILSSNPLEINNSMESLDMLPALRNLNLQVDMMQFEGWGVILDHSSKRLQRLKRLTVEFKLSGVWLHPPLPNQPYPQVYLETYKGILDARSEIWKGKKVIWENKYWSYEGDGINFVSGYETADKALTFIQLVME